MTYRVQRLTEPLELDCNWDKDVWKDVPALDVKHFMGKKPEHLPKTQAKVLYDDEAVYVIFRVEDQYVRAVGQKHQDMVCFDSCAEFFFTPGTDIAQGYFNFEINCGGTMLLWHQTKRDENVRVLTEAECEQVEIAHSLPKVIDPEITEPTTWTLEYRIPLALLEEYAAVTKPGPGVTWRANFYKCADKTSHPHWLTWAVVDLPGPSFHEPQFFGQLIFK